MLKGIDPLITPELLKAMAEMGHDDALVLADCNFTARRLAGDKPVVRLPGVGLVRAAQAVQSLLPLAADVAHPVAYMQVEHTQPPYRCALQREVLSVLAPALLDGQEPEALARYDFYERARGAFAIVVTGEPQPYGNFILRKGAIGENLRP